MATKKYEGDSTVLEITPPTSAASASKSRNEVFVVNMCKEREDESGYTVVLEKEIRSGKLVGSTVVFFNSKEEIEVGEEVELDKNDYTTTASKYNKLVNGEIVEKTAIWLTLNA
jgi:hypothetical protein